LPGDSGRGKQITNGTEEPWKVMEMFILFLVVMLSKVHIPKVIKLYTINICSMIL
jgi:hypothetical protein